MKIVEHRAGARVTCVVDSAKTVACKTVTLYYRKTAIQNILYIYVVHICSPGRSRQIIFRIFPKKNRKERKQFDVYVGGLLHDSAGAYTIYVF